jgi:hypothetical protein
MGGYKMFYLLGYLIGSLIITGFITIIVGFVIKKIDANSYKPPIVHSISLLLLLILAYFGNNGFAEFVITYPLCQIFWYIASKTKQKALSALFILIVIFGIIILATVFEKTKDTKFSWKEKARVSSLEEEKEKALLLEKDLKNLKHEFDKILPLRIDDITVLTKVDVDGEEIIFNYLVSELKGNLSFSLMQKVKSEVIRNICNDKFHQKLLIKGARYKYVYQDFNPKYFFNFTIISNDCKV